MKNNLERLEELSIKDLQEWANRNLNPHQSLIVSLDGVKIISDEASIPFKEEENNA